MNETHEFTAAAQHAGLHIQAIDPSGAICRVSAEGDRPGQQSGWYLFNADAGARGWFGNWRTGEKRFWRSGRGREMTRAERNEQAETARRYEQDRRQRQSATYMQARGEALRKFKQSMPADPAHPYLARKGVGVYGIRQVGTSLLIPLCDSTHQIWSLQKIDPEGNMRFLPGGRTHGMFHLIGPAPDAVLYVAEDYAAAASIHEATGRPAAATFDVGNLGPVAAKIRRAYPRAQIVICTDDDSETAARIGPIACGCQRDRQEVAP